MLASGVIDSLRQSRSMASVSALAMLGLLLISWPAPWASLLSGLGLVATALLWWRLRRRSDEAAAPAGGALAIVQRQYDESEQRFRALLESLPKVAVQGYDSGRRVIYWNEASSRLYGYRPEEAAGQRLEDLIIPEAMRGGVIAAHHAWVSQGVEIPAAELELRHRSGQPVAVFSHHVMLGQHTDNPLMFCVDVDLSDQKRARRDLDFITRFDPLTMLPNRQTFEDELEESVGHCRRHGEALAVIFVDLDKFSEINDLHGYEQGDALLVQVAQRLRERLRGSDLLSRFGSNEFVMAFPHLQAGSNARQLVDKLVDAFHEPFSLDHQEVHVTASLGISLFPDNGDNARELILNADIAKHRAKSSINDRFWFFDQQVHDEVVQEHRLAVRLRQALHDDELCLFYQPQVAPGSGRIECLEALLRWFPREGGAISPAEFIPVAERSDLIERLGEWVIHEVCRQQAEWKAAGLDDYRIDINLSGKQVAHLTVFDRLEACMAEFGLSARDIGIELTENVLIEADERILSALCRLYHRGMKIAIDDFGTGYSSLSYLKLFPVTALKIDRHFVQDAPDAPSDRAIMAATVLIGHQLGLEVVAEGVENEEQLELVRELGCDLVQGYYYFKPMSAEGIGKLLGGLIAHGDSRSYN